jgi:hypothetical protein
MRRRFQLFLACLIVASSANALAEPPERADLPANPAWFLHIDCDALRDTYLGQFMLYQWTKPEVYSNVLSFQSVFGFDFRTNLHGITIYDANPNPSNTIAIIYADLDADHLVASFREKTDAKTIRHDHDLIYAWHDPNGDQKYAAIVNNRLLLGQRKASMIAALSTINSATPKVFSVKELPEWVASDTVFFQASATNMDSLAFNPYLALLRNASRVSFQASETNQQLTATLTAKLADETTAAQTSIVAQGLIAMLSLQKDTPEAARLAEHFSLSRNGSTLTAVFSIPSADLVTAMKEYSKRTKPAAPAAH